VEEDKEDQEKKKKNGRGRWIKSNHRSLSSNQEIPALGNPKAE
jgi:hypothetical protein